MDFQFGWLVVAAVLVLVSVFAHLVSRRFGAPILLVFLLLGMLAGEDGPLGIEFNDAKIAFLVGSMALAVILFDGGVRTPMAAVRVAWGPALVLASVGVVVTAGVVALFLIQLFDMEWRRAMLVGSVVAFLLYFGLARRRGYATAAYISALTPPVAMTVSTLFEGKSWGVLALAGIVLVLLGQVLLLRAKKTG